MSRPTPPTRSLTPNPKWPTKQCERCGTTFWVTNAQFNYTKFCSTTCNDEPPEVRLWKNTIVGGLEECWNCTLAPGSEYPTIKVSGVQTKASRLSLELLLGRPIHEGLQALHWCDNPRCVSWVHLHEGTQKQNIQECVERGRLDDRRGVKCPTAKLSEEQARDIKFNPDGLSGKELTIRHSISKSQVSAIQHDRMWRHLSS